jgi:peptide/nickel transport system substrate-binding protein
VDRKQRELTDHLAAYFETLGVDRRHFLKLVAAAGAGAALVGQGSVSVRDASARQAAPVTPKVLTVRNLSEISNAEPHISHDVPTATCQKSLYDSLLRYQGNPPELQNLLATKYESNEDASEWTFTLDDRAVFHDGTPVTASDVVYSVGRLIRKNKGPAWMFVNILDENSAQAVDDHTVKFSLTTPFAPLPLILPWLFIVNEKLVKQHEVDGDEGEAWLMTNEAGSGPFTIKRWQPGDLFEFEAVPDYWWGWPEEGRLAGYIFKIIRESSSARLALLAGEVQFIFDLQAEDVEAVSKEPGIIVSEEPSLTVFAVKLNNQHGPTSDINVRKAISYAMDYDAIIAARNGRSSLLVGPLPTNLGDYHDPDLQIYRLDMDKAKEALAASAYPDGGFELEFAYVAGDLIEEQIGLILLDKLSELNIGMKMTPITWPDLVARVKDAETAPDMSAIYSGTDYADPDNFLWQAYHSSQADFWAAASHYKNPELDKLLESARATPDHDERVDLYRKAQQMLVADAVEVWGHSDFAPDVLSDKVGGYHYNPIMGYYLQPLWLKD